MFICHNNSSSLGPMTSPLPPQLAFSQIHSIDIEHIPDQNRNKFVIQIIVNVTISIAFLAVWNGGL